MPPRYCVSPASRSSVPQLARKSSAMTDKTIGNKRASIRRKLERGHYRSTRAKSRERGRSLCSGEMGHTVLRHVGTRGLNSAFFKIDNPTRPRQCTICLPTNTLAKNAARILKHFNRCATNRSANVQRNFVAKKNGGTAR